MRVVKRTIGGFVLALVFVLNGLAQKTAQRPSIAVTFTIDGVSVLCDNLVVELHVGKHLVPVERIDHGFIVPSIFSRLYASPPSRRKNNIGIHVTCDAYAFDFQDEYPVRLLPGVWELAIDYPDSWFERSSGAEIGEWVSSIEWACDECEPVVVESQTHSSIPAEVVERLRKEQPAATGTRAMEIAFALAVFGLDRERNRNYLVDLLTVCLSSPDKPAIEGICDHVRLTSMIANLYLRGDSELLNPLLKVADSDAYVAEEIGDFYAEMLDRRPAEILRGMESLPIAKKQAVCRLAGENEHSVEIPRFQRIAENLRTTGSDLARGCLQTAQVAAH